MRNATPLSPKLYLLMHRVTRRRQYVEADSFQSACEQLGWLPAETCVLKVLPVAPEPTSTPQRG